MRLQQHTSARKLKIYQKFYFDWRGDFPLDTKLCQKDDFRDSYTHKTYKLTLKALKLQHFNILDNFHAKK